ncbi:hypothetical protein RvY_02808 [Ramazzottius varieornatus]|uniref:Uncharacterized protein n=1 Tax=Ramazzottius varieornatus TaxID=947166 RepID=A0A1D1UW59_RAMVA|nr:hypothetical protein RvY_02808 [Ramazzottius varieornatus]
MLVEGKISDGDISGALRVLSLKDSVAAPTPQVPEVLSEKHEAAESSNSSFSDPPNQGTLPDEVATEEVIAAVKSFPNGSAGGVDGSGGTHPSVNSSRSVVHSKNAKPAKKQRQPPAQVTFSPADMTRVCLVHH